MIFLSLKYSIKAFGLLASFNQNFFYSLVTENGKKLSFNNFFFLSPFPGSLSSLYQTKRQVKAGFESVNKDPKIFSLT